MDGVSLNEEINSTEDLTVRTLANEYQYKYKYHHYIIKLNKYTNCANKDN